MTQIKTCPTLSGRRLHWCVPALCQQVCCRAPCSKVTIPVVPIVKNGCAERASLARFPICEGGGVASSAAWLVPRASIDCYKLLRRRFAGLISKWNMVERLQAHIAKNYADSLLPATECNLVKTGLVRFRAVDSTVPAHGTMGGLCTQAVRPPCSNRKNNTYVGAGRPHLWTSRDWRHWPGLATSRKNLNHWSSLL